ncbi:NUDIX domain-containing protein [Paenibacillus sp. PL2-23]|uniref:NUDIX hydrolase n=1 Tax=Paenibacillus sp. PL2-23 TaxID=2100729 RepID=UPI0030FC3155
MDFVREIYERDLGLSGRDAGSRRHGNQVWLGRSVRGVIFDAQGQVALIPNGDGPIGSLLGGGIEGQETLDAALSRVAMGQLGAPIRVLNEVGLVVEYQDEHELVQFTYAYTAELKMPQLTEEANASGLKVGWLSLREAIDVLQRNRPDSYAAKFQQERDLSILMSLRK